MKRFGFSACVLALCSALLAQEERNISSGPRVGSVLPGPFDCLNINGKNGKDRQHCLVCEFGLGPVVMVFTKEPAEGKDGPISDLLQKLDGLVGQELEKSAVNSFVVFLSPDARNSANQSKVEDPDQLVEEAKAREALIARLRPHAEKLKHVVVACYLPEGPKGYTLNPQADVTVLLYRKHKVLANFAYGKGQFRAEDAASIVKSVEATLAKKK